MILDPEHTEPAELMSASLTRHMVATFILLYAYFTLWTFLCILSYPHFWSEVSQCWLNSTCVYFTYHRTKKREMGWLSTLKAKFHPTRTIDVDTWSFSTYTDAVTSLSRTPFHIFLWVDVRLDKKVLVLCIFFCEKRHFKDPWGNDHVALWINTSCIDWTCTIRYFRLAVFLEASETKLVSTVTQGYYISHFVVGVAAWTSELAVHIPLSRPL